MKKTIILCVIALLMSAGMMAQSPDQSAVKTRKQARLERKAQVQDQTRIREQDPQAIQEQARTRNRVSEQDKNQTRSEILNNADEHGRAVNETAKNAESGPGKGEVVSRQAKARGEAKQAHPSARNKAVTGGIKGPGNAGMPQGQGPGR